jgi:hypothetical protein
MNKKKSFDSLTEDVQQKYIQKAYDNLVDSGFLPFVDEPIEDSPKFDWVCEVAQEMYEEEND